MVVRHFLCRFFVSVMVSLLLAGCQAGGRVPVPPTQAEVGNAATAGGAVAPTEAALNDGYDLATAQYYAGQAMRRQACFAQKRAGMREAEATAMVGGHVAAATMMAGPGGRVAGKAIGVGTARVVRGQIQQLQADPC